VLICFTRSYPVDCEDTRAAARLRLLPTSTRLPLGHKRVIVVSDLTCGLSSIFLGRVLEGKAQNVGEKRQRVRWEEACLGRHQSDR